jgi:hypothetical protein
MNHLALLRILALSGIVWTGCKSPPTDLQRPKVVTEKVASAPAVPPIDPRCETPCRFLSETGLAAAPDVYKKTCNKDWPAALGNTCEPFDFQRNCIYADKGYTFRNAKWRDVFSKQTWYAGRPDFKETDLSSIARANIQELKRSAIDCRADTIAPIPTKFDASKVSKKDLAIIIEWFADRRDGRVFLPKLLLADNEVISPDRFKENWIDHKYLFQVHPWTPIKYDSGPTPDAVTAIGAVKTIDVRTGDRAPDCLQKLKPDQDTENCEGFETITFYLDKNGAIVAIAVAAYG